VRGWLLSCAATRALPGARSWSRLSARPRSAPPGTRSGRWPWCARAAWLRRAQAAIS
jgi:hypothetical protein